MITKDDCPTEIAEPYPGLVRKDLRSGIVLTRGEYLEKTVKEWVEHFGDSENFQTTSLAKKAVYLFPHLIALKVNYNGAKKLLVAFESKQPDTEVAEINNVEPPNDGAASDEEIMDDDGEYVEDMEDNEGGGGNMEMDNPEEDEDMFCEDDNNESKRSAIEFEIEKMLSKTNKEIFEEDLEVPDTVQKSRRFMKRKKEYTETYVTDNFVGLSSQEILVNFSQNPAAVQDSQAMKERLKHLKREEKANRTVLKAVRDTIDALTNTPGQKAKDQVKTVTAAVTHHRWGTPGLEGVGDKAKRVAKMMKLDLLKGNTSVLTPPVKPSKKMYPKEVEDLTIKHWLQNTTIEPALHARKAVSDEKETVPTRYQSLTDKEQYCQFKEDCSDQIEIIMTRQTIDNINKINKRPDSADKTKRLAYYATLEPKFPSIDWFLDRKPEEVKPLHDHTTALCKTCEAALINYTTLVKQVKSQCQCSTNMCPEWLCMCPSRPDDMEEEGEILTCSCKCSCDDCTNCKV